MKRIMLVTIIFLLTITMAACGDQTPTDEEAPPASEVEPAEEAAEESVEARVEEPVEEPVEESAEEPEQEAIAAPEEVAPEETTAEAAAEGSLTGVIWNLTSLNGQPLLPTTSITAEFSEDGTVGGSSGCNNYNAVYETDGSSITINSSPAAMTLMACPEPIMEQERAYLEALSAAATYEVSADSLSLFDADGNLVAVFEVVSQDLAGSSWEVISYNNGRGGVTSVIIGTEITAEFGETGELTGFSGCNNYFGPYETDGETISMGPFGTTRKACLELEGVMQQEGEYLAALETAATYSIDGMTMNMRTAEGSTVANFRRMMPEDEFVTEAEEEIALTPEMISLDTEALGTTWEAVVVEETPYDESMPPGPVGMPTHIEVLFGGTTDPTDVLPTDPVMYIIPVNSYRKLWEEAGNDAVTRTIQGIQDLNFILPSPTPTLGYPVLPYEQVGAGVNDVAVQVGRAVSQAELNTTSSTQDGYRLVGRWSQDASPISNYGPRYVYQGFTNDGVYLISFWWPVTTEALPDSSELTKEQIDAFYADPEGYLNSKAEELNALSTDQWQPDLADLDAVVASLQIEGTPASGLVDKTWEWTEGPAQPGSSDIVTIEDPSLYQVVYGSDGQITYTADCNSGSMPYEISNAGMTGSMLAQPGPTTLAACGPESLSESFAASLQAAQSYRVWAGGNEMELVLPAGGGFLQFRDADAPEIPSSKGAAVTGMVTNVDNAVIPAGATTSIQIQDTSLADAPAQVIGEQIIKESAQFPIAYQVDYDPSEIIDNHTYTMRVRIESTDGSLLFINDTAIPVITNGNPTENVEIPVIQVGG
jgi:heat shock protein HslJ